MSETSKLGRSAIRAIGRGYQLARHHRPAQFVSRIIRIGRRARWRAFGYPQVQCRVAEWSSTATEVLAKMEDMLRETRAYQDLSFDDLLHAPPMLTLLNRSVHCDEPIEWRSQRFGLMPHLWKFHLAYQEYIPVLLASGQADEAALATRLWRSWVESFSVRERDDFQNWFHPYCISRRIVSWVHGLALGRHAIDADLRRRVLTALAEHAALLEMDQETDLGGNHLLDNYRAAILVGALVTSPAAQRFAAKARQRAMREASRQFLNHGEHCELSPMYHLNMLCALVDTAIASQAEDGDFSRLVFDAAGRAAGFLERVLHPDGGVPLFGDSTLDSNVAPQSLINWVSSRTKRRECIASAETTVDNGRLTGHYWTAGSSGDFCVFDMGPPGCEHLPAHGHADLLGFEISLSGRRAIVDSGVAEYEAGPNRNYFRGTSAHNVCALDHQELCDVWGSFRMGRRGRITQLEAGRSESVVWARASHDAFRIVGVPEIWRAVGLLQPLSWVVFDWFPPSPRQHHATRWLHLHPDAVLEQLGTTEVEVTFDGSARYRIRAHGGGELLVIEGRYADHFGLARSAPVLEHSVPSAAGRPMAWSVERLDALVDPTFACDSDGPFVAWSAKGLRCEWRPFLPST